MVPDCQLLALSYFVLGWFFRSLSVLWVEKASILMKPKTIKHIISIPFIWGVALPTMVLHLCLFIYQAVAFRLYGMERVQLRSYINFDREKLGYLRVVDKLNCGYCSYVNGVFAYISEIGRRTEYYWCGVKHENWPDNPAFAYQEKFAAYGDKEAYEKHLVQSGRVCPPTKK
jgi:hypothetical protein